jgi:hypothetical protein
MSQGVRGRKTGEVDSSWLIARGGTDDHGGRGVRREGRDGELQNENEGMRLSNVGVSA